MQKANVKKQKKVKSEAQKRGGREKENEQPQY